MLSFFKNLTKPQDETEDEQLQDVPLSLRGHSAFGAGCDVIPNAKGEFGCVSANPIPVNCVRGSIKYLNRLLCSCHKSIIAHRLGHIDEQNIAGSIDVYETVCSEMIHWDILYLHFYHPRRSRITPAGYIFGKFHPVFSKTTIGMSTNQACNDFPIGMRSIITEMLEIKPLLADEVIRAIGYNLENAKLCVRPQEQIRKIGNIVQTNRFEGYVPSEVFGKSGALVRITPAK